MSQTPTLSAEAAQAGASMSVATRSRPAFARLAAALLLALFMGVALLTRLQGIDVTITADEGYWTQRTLRFGAALARGDWNSTFRTGHPGVTLMWLGMLGIGPTRLEPLLPTRYIDTTTLELAPNYLDAQGAARRAVVLATAGLTVICVALTAWLFGRPAGLTAGLFLLLDPYYIGMSRLLHVDAILAPLMAVSALSAMVYWLRRGGRWFLVLSAVTGGLALLTKAPAGYLVIYIGLLGLIGPARSPAASAATNGRLAVGGLKSSSKSWRLAASIAGRLRPLMVWGLIAAALYYALWPAMWADPLQRLTSVFNFLVMVAGKPHHYWPTYFLGEVFVADPGAGYYPLALVYRLSPVVLLGLVSGLIMRGHWPGRRSAVLWLAVYAVFFVIVMSPGPKKLDRYMLPAIVVFDLVAGVALWKLAEWLPGRIGQIGLGLLLIGQVAQCLRTYPYPLAYYNPLFGGARGAYKVMLVGWGEGLDQVLTFLNAQPDIQHKVLALHYDHILRPRFRGTTVPSIAPVPIDYFVVYVNMKQRWGVLSAAQQKLASGPPVFKVTIDGVDFARVYRADPPVLQQPALQQAPEEGDETP